EERRATDRQPWHVRAGLAAQAGEEGIDRGHFGGNPWGSWRRRAAMGGYLTGKRCRIIADAQIPQSRERGVVQVTEVGVEYRVVQGRLVLVRPVGRERHIELVRRLPQHLAANARHARPTPIVGGLVTGLR